MSQIIDCAPSHGTAFWFPASRTVADPEEKKSKMRKICAWCGTNLEAVRSDAPSDPIITHGICSRCSSRFFREFGENLKAFLDSLAAPVLVVDSTVRVKTANRQAQLLLKKDLPSIVGYTGGDVFECEFAKRAGGCGHSLHCSGCAIRNTIKSTFETGKSHLNVSACLNSATPIENQKIDMLISTQKVGEIVLLRIDRVGASPTGNKPSSAGF